MNENENKENEELEADGIDETDEISETDDTDEIDEINETDGIDETDGIEKAEAFSDTAPKKDGDSFSRAFEWVETFAVYFAIGLFLILAFFRHSPVIGTSMVPTLSNGDVLIVSKLAYTPKAGDIVVCQSEIYGLDTPLVKRVIATSGQTVKIDYENWTVTVDGVTLDEDYINRQSNVSMRGSDYLPTEFTVKEGYIFVMGDNRNGSTDSRSSSVGLIDERYVMGKVTLKIFPLKDFKIYR